MEYLHVIILGIVEGITEFLPISSTGHLILVSHILGIVQTEFLSSFEIAIQLGAVAAVLFFLKKWDVFSLSSLKKVIAAFIPTALAGFLLYGYIKDYFLGNELVVVLALFMGGAVMVIVELAIPVREEGDIKIGSLSYKKAIGVGLFQSISIIPGVSRAAATIIGGRVLGLSRRAAVEFSFILAVPTMLAATGYDLFKSGGDFSSEQIITLLLGFFLSFAVAMFAIKFLLSFIKNHTFISFGIYRIALSVIFWAFIM